MIKTVSDLQMILGQVAKYNSKRRFYSLIDKICDQQTLWEAWLQVQRNDGASGIDGKAVSYYEEAERVEALISEIQTEVLTGNYQASPVLRVEIDKPDGGKRPLGIPIVKDRVLQTAVKLILEPIFESDFQDFSYGFRPARGCHQALQAVWKWNNFGYTKVVDADISKFFDTIPHDKLLRSVAKRVSDGKVLWLLKQFLKAPISISGSLQRSTKGTPQGGVVSPLLANIYLNHLDTFWVKKGYVRNAKIVRYADDFVILCKSGAEFYLNEAKRLLDNLDLNLNLTKTKIVDSKKQGFDFLGFSFRRSWAFRPKLKKFGYVTGVGLARKVIRKVKCKINSITGQGGRKSPVPIRYFVEKINEWIKHWLPYYCYANRKDDIKHVFLNLVLARLVRAEVARKSSRKRQSRKWKSWNPQIWYERYNLINMVAEYYKKRKQLYTKLTGKDTINAWS